MYEVNGKNYPCCTSVTMGIIGGKWKTVILYHLMVNGTLRYSQLRKLMNTVTERSLSLQLQQLQEDGIVKRKVYTSKPPLKVEYSLTEFGSTLNPLLKLIAEWGESAVERTSK